MLKAYLSFIFSLTIVCSLMGQVIQGKLTGKFTPDKAIITNQINDDDLANKVDPFFKFTVNKINSLQSKGELSEKAFSELSKHIRINKNMLPEISASVFVRTNNISATSADITSAGGFVYTRAGDIITAEIPLSSLRFLAHRPEVVFIQGSQISKPMIDISRVQTKVNQLHDGTGISRPYKGNNVVVGVLDSGIDWKHADFKTAEGNRIKYLWDMSGQGNPPSGYNYGTEYTQAQLNANQCNQVDGNDGGGHGTHVAGTAAGNGGANSQYIGMAPESDIIFVKGFRNGPGFADVDVVNGCNYIFQKASQLQMPAVINLSLGGSFGPHDGTSLYEQALSNLTGNGKIIVAAAGNSGDETIHVGYAASGTSVSDARQTVWIVPDNTSVTYSDMWYNSGNISVGIVAYNSNFEMLGYTNPVAPGQTIQDVPFTISGITYGWVTIDASNTNDPNNNGKEVIFVIDSHNGQVNLGNVYWAIYTFGTGTFDAWNLEGIFDPYNQPGYVGGDNLKTVGSPGTADKLICVGSYVTKTSWVDVNGVTQNQPGSPVNGAISSFSSLGPSRDNRLKPDLVAPGEVIIAALSSSLTQVPPQNILLGGKHQKMQGTSMAAPHVTGAIALLLEKKSDLNYDQAVTILKNTTVKDNFTGSSPNNIYGYGKLNAYNAFLNTGGGGTQVTLLQESFDTSFPPSGWQTTVLNPAYTWSQGNVENKNFNQIDPTSIYSAICPWVAANQNEWLITPAFNLGNGNASVEFYAGYSTEWLTFATLNLKLSTNNGSSWLNLWTAENDQQQWIWRQRTIDLTPYANQNNLKLGWQYIGNDGDIVAIDAVKVTGFTLTSVQDNTTLPNEYALYQNYPNPFNPSTRIRFDLPRHSRVTLKIYDILGNEVTTLLNEEKPAGNYEIPFNASALSSGVYFYQLNTGSNILINKMLLLK